MIEPLEAAARRCDDYLAQYGVELIWSITSSGLKINGQWGASKVERLIYWDELRDCRPNHINRQMEIHEQQVLKGLSD